MNRFSRTCLFIAAFGLLSAPALASLSEIGTETTLVSNTGGYGSAMIDTTNGFVAFGSSVPALIGPQHYSYIETVNITPAFARASTLAFFPTVTDLTAAAFDPGTGFSYWVSSAIPSTLEKISNPEIPLSFSDDFMTFQSGQNSIATAVIDPVNQYGYFGTHTSPSMVIKVRLTDLSIISSLTLPAGLDFLSASVIDTANGFAYFGSSTTTGAVAKIRLSDLTLAGTLTFSSGEGGVASAIIDVTKQLAYFGTHDNPGKIVEIQLSNFTRLGSLALVGSQNDLTSAVADFAHGTAYFGTNTAPGIVVPIGLANFTARTALVLGAGEDFLRSAVIDTTNRYAYFGTYTLPGHVIKVDLLAGPPTILVQPTDANIHSGETAFFSVSAEGRSLTYQWQKNGVDIPGATSASYSLTVTAADDGTTFRCVLTDPDGSQSSDTAQVIILPVVRAYPNPWRADRHTGASITFDGLLPNSTVKIYDLAAHWVKSLPMATGSVTWDRTNDAGELVATGYYFYSVTGRTNKQGVTGKLAIIR